MCFLLFCFFSEIICDRQHIENVVIENVGQRYKLDGQATYICKDGYEGNPTRICRENGWTGGSECKGKEVQTNKFIVGMSCCVYVWFYMHEFKIDSKGLPSWPKLSQI